MSVEENYTEN